jgi:hypothetical protein
LKFYAAAFLLVTVFLPLRAAAGPGGAPALDPVATDILDRYVKAMQMQESHPQAVSMDVDMDADLPKLKKHGRFHAFRFITRVGQIFYDKRRFEGDGTIKKEVIGRYLQAEKDAKSGYGSALAVTPANYKFKYKGTTDYAGRTAYVFQVNPKHKQIGMYKGEIWIDKETELPLRQWGELVRNPSLFLKNVYFVRDFMIYDGVSVPRRLISDVSTRLFGNAHLTIWYENVKVGDPVVKTATLNGSAQTVQVDGGHN